MSKVSSKSKELDQFFTKESVSIECVEVLSSIVGLSLDKKVFVEPSAGSGSFVKSLRKIFPSNEIEYFDIDPQFSGTIKKDFLNEDIVFSTKEKDLFFIGNPPFGKKASLAIDFVNRSLDYGDYAAFILPLTFRRFSVQSKIKKEAYLIHDNDLNDNLFEFNGKDHLVRCCFQIWTTDESLSHLNFRKVNPPASKHSDFESWIYNATKSSEKFFDYDWDIAVLRQGWGDFQPVFKKEIINSGIELSRKKQWIFIKAHSDQILKNILSIDFEKLAEANTSVRGFGKGDLVDEYTRLFGASEVKRSISSDRNLFEIF